MSLTSEIWPQKTSHRVAIVLLGLLLLGTTVGLVLTYIELGAKRTSLRDSVETVESLQTEHSTVQGTLDRILDTRVLLLQLTQDVNTTRTEGQKDSYGTVGLTEIDPSQLVHSGKRVSSLCFVPPETGFEGAIEPSTGSQRIYVCHTRYQTTDLHLGIVLPRKSDGRYVLVDVLATGGLTGNCRVGPDHAQHLSTIDWTGSILPMDLNPTIEHSETLPTLTCLQAITGTIYPWESYLKGYLPLPAPTMTSLTFGSQIS